jgi:hypothetical protein
MHATQRPLAEGASAALDRILTTGDPGALLQPLVALVRSGAPRVRVTMLGKLAALLPAAHARRPGATARTVLPAVARLFDEGKPDERTGATDVLVRVAAALGPEVVLDAARAAGMPEGAADRLRRVLGARGGSRALLGGRGTREED